MDDATDMDLLRQYVGRNSDTAFAALVSRHVNLVYSAALRKTGNPDAAEEITQAVFVILAQKAGRIPGKTVLPGWLYQTARLTAAGFLKSDARRARREQEAYMQTELRTTALDETWKELAPLLEDAMGQLGETERAAVVLRFFGDKSFAEMAAAFGVSENAAKKRVSHALEKLHRYFFKHGVSSTTAILAGAISANSIHAAPAALAKSVTAAAVAKGAAAGGSTLTLIKGALKIMALTKAKTAIVVGVAAILAVGTSTVVIHQYLNHWIFTSTKELSSDVEAQYGRYTGMTPEQAAKTFFEACSREDWTEAAKFCEPGNGYPVGDKFKNKLEVRNYLGGLQVVSLGKPFRGWIGGMKYGGVYVPYEIRLKNGRVEKWQVAIRCDNPDKRWYIDGGL
jgi:RNA polymerase sigma factor (sigma-70 family)